MIDVAEERARMLHSLHQGTRPFSELLDQGRRLAAEERPWNDQHVALLADIAWRTRDPDLAAVVLPVMPLPERARPLLRAARMQLLVGDLRGGADAHQRALDAAVRERFPATTITGVLELACDLGVDRAEVTLHTIASQRPQHEHPFAVHLPEGLDPSAMERLASTVAERSRIPIPAAERCLTRTIDLEARTPIRMVPLPWHAPNSFLPTVIEDLTRRILHHVETASAFSLVRLGDGEGRLMMGDRPNLNGSVGLDARGKRLELDAEEYTAFRATFLESLAEADIVGIPDLSQIVIGPKGCIAVMQAIPDGLTDSLALVSGGWGLPSALEATGAFARLMPVVHGIIGPIPPDRIAPLAGRDVEWLSTYGETRRYSTTGESHLRTRFPSIMAHDFRPGQLWLVGAGMLGKLYCTAIRRGGGVAIDVGSLMDLWSGRQDTRGQFRSHPWLCRPYVDIA